MKRRGRWWGVLILGALVPAAPAQAGTVQVEPMGKTNGVAFRAAAGEANRVITSSDGATVTVRDRGAPVTAGAGCVQVTAKRATCALAGLVQMHVELKGGKDSLRVKEGPVRLLAYGGAGADRIIGGGSSDFIDGGSGPDVLDGRGGVDGVDYSSRTQPVRVTLADGKRNDGGKQDGAKRDRLRRFEYVRGGSGNDVLAGNKKDNTLSGGGGRDVLRGRGGDDSLIGDDGNDRAFGGPGNDLFPGGNGRDRSFGGGGADHFQGGSPGNGADLFSGGKGRDTAQYSFGHVRLSLDGKANDGPCGDATCTFSDEGDNLVSIEILQAGFGNDVLIGSKANEEFSPSLGADIVLARGGNDIINVSVDGDPDVYNCGAGIDALVGMPDAFDQNPNCE